MEGEEDEEDAEYEEGSQPAQSRGESEAGLHEDGQQEEVLGAGGKRKGGVRGVPQAGSGRGGRLTGLSTTAPAKPTMPRER